jgi:endonuclease YncB( thermonuclease family)
MIKLIFLLSLLTLAVQNETFNAKVIGVTDGDTIVVLTDENKQIKIRLEGIDCPETKQDFGTKAKQLTVDLCFQKTVRVEQSGTDRYGRMLAFVFVDNVSINKELIKQGMAWHYKQYNKDQELAKLEVDARKEKVGLWSMKEPIPPWDFRKK